MAQHFTDSVKYIESSDINGDMVENMPGTAVIMIQSAKCGHCVSAKPEFQAFADALAGSDIGAYTCQADLDGEATKAIAKMVPGFRGFPTFVLFRDGQYVSTHDGPRTADALMAFAQSGGGNRTELNLPPRSRRVRFE